MFKFRADTLCRVSTAQNQEFQAVDWSGEDSRNLDSSYDDGCNVKERFLIKIYGVTGEGRSICTTVYGFKPYFFFELPEDWTPSVLKAVITRLKDKVDKRSKAALFEHRVVTRQKFMGFRNGAKNRFVCLSFFSKKGMRDYIGLLEKPISIPGRKGSVRVDLYESDIDPLLRFMHCQDLRASGWINLPASSFSVDENAASRCQINLITEHDKVLRADKEDIAPVITASFDIEVTCEPMDFFVSQLNTCCKFFAPDTTPSVFENNLTSITKQFITEL